jgi:hypothetical protein
MIQKIFTRTLFFSFIVLAVLSCQKQDDGTDIEDGGQQIGDVMASIDEAGGSGGTLGREELEDRSACGTSTFGACSSNVIVRTFGGCSIESATLSGTVTLTWGGGSASCAMASAGDTVTRAPAFTLTGRRGATLTVSKTASFGQKLTWASGAGASKVFNFTNDGIRRVFTGPGGNTLFDFTTETTSAITITGTTRAGRTVNGGTLRVTNNVSGVTCDYSPSNLTGASTCTCATSGSWSGTCSDGKTTTLTLTGCGTATFAIGSDSTSVSFDRCYGI